MNPRIFRQYDIRGIADEDLTDDVVLAVGRALGAHFRDAGVTSAGIGRDVRLSSPRIAGTLVRALTDSGLHVTDVGEVPTPVLYHATHHEGLGAGVMVTGSHNPIAYNGIKLVRGGAAVYGDEIQAIGARAAEGRFVSGEGSVRTLDAYPAYRAEVLPKLTPVKPLRIVVDCGNGAGALLAVSFFRALGHEVDPLFCEPDGRFPNHLPDPTVPALMEALSKRVVETGADLGLGFDGDADRVGAVDGDGRLVFGDQILALLARDLLERRSGAAVLFDVKCSQSLVDDITAHGGRPVMGPTGHSLIKAKMKAEGISLAGEMSGHMFLGEDYYGFDDALFAGGRLLAALARWGRPLSELIDSLPHYRSTPEIRVDCPDDRKFEIVEALVAAFTKTHEVVDVDGARVQFGDGWGLVRASNTQPVLVFRFEARNEARLAEIRNVFREALKAFPDVHLPASDA